MTLEKFQEEFNGAPYDLIEFAEVAAKLVDCPKLADAADDYMGAMRNFIRVLNENQVEVG